MAIPKQAREMSEKNLLTIVTDESQLSREVATGSTLVLIMDGKDNYSRIMMNKINTSLVLDNLKKYGVKLVYIDADEAKQFKQYQSNQPTPMMQSYIHGTAIAKPKIGNVPAEVLLDYIKETYK